MAKTNHLHLACALITNEYNEMLIVKKQNTEVFIMPGGKIEHGETPEQALQRELLEEIKTSINLQQMTLLGHHTTIASNEKNTQVTARIFHIKLAKTQIKVANEIQEAFWMNYQDYTKYTLANLLKEFSLPIWLKMQV